MTLDDFYQEFDLLYNNIASNQAPGLDKYEISVFLTKAQDEIIKNYFNPKSNKYREGFDDKEKRQIDFSTIIKIEKATEVTDASIIKLDDDSKLFKMPKDIMFVLNEIVTLKDSKKKDSKNNVRIINIIPINFDEYSRIMSKPFKKPYKSQGWRLFQSKDNTPDIISEIITGSTDDIDSYKIRYVKRPRPIILDNSTINKQTGPSTCELNEILHPEILQRAVELAKAAYVGEVKNIVELGQRSE